MTTRQQAPVLVAVAAIALAFGVTGGAVAGTMVTGKQIKNASVTGKDIKNHSLGTNDLSSAALTALHGANGTNGTNGNNGTAGAPGAPGAAGVSGLVQVSQLLPVAAATPATLELDCPAGKKLVGAAGFWATASDAVQVVFTDDNSASVFTPGIPAADTLFIQVVCITALGSRTSSRGGLKGGH
jgi:hypothetical protein